MHILYTSSAFTWGQQLIKWGLDVIQTNSTLFVLAG